MLTIESELLLAYDKNTYDESFKSLKNTVMGFGGSFLPTFLFFFQGNFIKSLYNSTLVVILKSARTLKPFNVRHFFQHVPHYKLNSVPETRYFYYFFGVFRFNYSYKRDYGFLKQIALKDDFIGVVKDSGNGKLQDNIISHKLNR